LGGKGGKAFPRNRFRQLLAAMVKDILIFQRQDEGGGENSKSVGEIYSGPT